MARACRPDFGEHVYSLAVTRLPTGSTGITHADTGEHRWVRTPAQLLMLIWNHLELFTWSLSRTTV